MSYFPERRLALVEVVADLPYTGILQLDKFFEDAEKHDRLHD